MERIKSSTKVVCDAGPLIHLDEIGSFHLLNDFQTILLPESVYNEVLASFNFHIDFQQKVLHVLHECPLLQNHNILNLSHFYCKYYQPQSESDLHVNRLHFVQNTVRFSYTT